MRKTIFQWLWTIKDVNIRELALANYRRNVKGQNGHLIKNTVRHSSTSHVLTSAFVWSVTPEGGNFWRLLSVKELKVKDSVNSLFSINSPL